MARPGVDVLNDLGRLTIGLDLIKVRSGNICMGTSGNARDAYLERISL